MLVSDEDCLLPWLLVMQGVAKLLSKSVSAQSSRLQQGFGALLTGQKDMIGDISKVASVTQSGAAGVAGSVMEWAKDASSEIADLIRRVDEKHSAATAVSTVVVIEAVVVVIFSN